MGLNRLLCARLHTSGEPTVCMTAHQWRALLCAQFHISGEPTVCTASHQRREKQRRATTKAKVRPHYSTQITAETPQHLSEHLKRAFHICCFPREFYLCKIHSLTFIARVEITSENKKNCDLWGIIMLLWDGGGSDNEVKKGMPTNSEDDELQGGGSQADRRWEELSNSNCNIL